MLKYIYNRYLVQFVKIQPQEYYPGFGQFIADLVDIRESWEDPLACADGSSTNLGLSPT